MARCVAHDHDIEPGEGCPYCDGDRLEYELLRQLREGNAKAKAAAEKRSYPLHPKLANKS